MKRAGIYARFSSDKQSGKSIDDQVRVCRGICERHGFNVAGLYEDRAISGAATVGRPGLNDLLRDAERGLFDVIVAEGLDRISRRLADIASIYNDLKFRDIKIVVSLGEITDMHIAMLGMMNEHYLTDLGEKTWRGQEGVALSGRHPGPPPYGYQRVDADENGVLAINEAPAEIVRRIFSKYLGGHHAREIAAELNAERIPGPRGGVWNASAIAGSRARGNGILQNALYDGRIVWNRQRFIKRPKSNKRISRPNPKAEWVEQSVPHLRIVDPKTFAAAQARKAQRASLHRSHRARPKHLLSGLLKCGCCGSGYIVAGSDKRGIYLRCSRQRETGLCDNRRSVSLASIERRVIFGLEKNLASPEAVARYVRTYHRAMHEHAGSAEAKRREIANRVTTIAAECRRLVDAIATAKATRTMRERLEALEAEREALERQAAHLSDPPVTFHPNAAEVYRRKVADLKKVLAEAKPDFRDQAFAIIRNLVEKIIIHPTGPYGPVDLEVHGQMAIILQTAEGTAIEQRSVGKVVAGARNIETHRLPALVFRLRGSG